MGVQGWRKAKIFSLRQSIGLVALTLAIPFSPLVRVSFAPHPTRTDTTHAHRQHMACTTHHHHSHCNPCTLPSPHCTAHARSPIPNPEAGLEPKSSATYATIRKDHLPQLTSSVQHLLQHYLPHYARPTVTPCHIANLCNALLTSPPERPRPTISA